MFNAHLLQQDDHPFQYCVTMFSSDASKIIGSPIIIKMLENIGSELSDNLFSGEAFQRTE